MIQLLDWKKWCQKPMTSTEELEYLTSILAGTLSERKLLAQIALAPASPVSLRRAALDRCVEVCLDSSENLVFIEKLLNELSRDSSSDEVRKSAFQWIMYFSPPLTGTTVDAIQVSAGKRLFTDAAWQQQMANDTSRSIRWLKTLN